MTWNRSEIRSARQIPLLPVLKKLGYRLEPRAHDNFALTSERCGEILIKDHYWHCPATGQSGNAIDFLTRIRGDTFQEAMGQLIQPKRS